MFYIWYTNLNTFLANQPFGTPIYYSILHTTASQHEYMTTKLVGLHLRAIDREKQTIHLLAIPTGRYQMLHGSPFDEKDYDRAQQDAEALRRYVLAEIQQGWDHIEAIPAVPSDIQYIYAEKPTDFRFDDQPAS